MRSLDYTRDLFNLMRYSNIFLGTSLEIDENDDFFTVGSITLSQRLEKIIGQDLSISLFDTGEMMLEVNFDVDKMQGKKKDFLNRTMEYLEARKDLDGSDIIEFSDKTVFLVSVKEVTGNNLKAKYEMLHQILRAVVDELETM